MQADKDLVFIVSGGRTGTKFFGTVLGDLVEGGFSVHEPDMLKDRLAAREVLDRISRFGFHYMVTGRLLGTRGLRPLSDRYLRGQVDLQSAALTIRRSREHYHATAEQRLVIESNSQWHGLLPPLRVAYPQARVVCIVRDPRDWITSTLNHGHRRGSRDTVERFGQQRISPGTVGDTGWAGRWLSMSPLQRLCWDWMFITSLLESFSQTDERARLFRFEDLFDPAQPDVRRGLLDFIATHEGKRYSIHDPEAAFRRRINASSGSTPQWQHWSSGDAAFLEAMCGPLMRRHGYGHEVEWHQLCAADSPA